MKNTKAKTSFLNVLSILIIVIFLTAGVVLMLVAAKVIGNVKKSISITCYVFGSIFLVLFLVIIIKIFLILFQENKYKKEAIDVEKVYANEINLEKNASNEEKFKDAPKQDKLSRNIFYTYLLKNFRKSYRNNNLEFEDVKVKYLIENFIIDVKKTYGLFDVYLAIEFHKSIARKFVLRGEYSKYRIYFDGIRHLIHELDDMVKDQLNFSK